MIDKHNVVFELQGYKVALSRKQAEDLIFRISEAITKADEGITVEHCLICDSPTGRAGVAEDSLFCADCSSGPFCDDCFNIHMDEHNETN